MKKILFGALVFGTVFTTNSAFAGQIEDAAARANSLEKENAAIRRENKALLENKSLRDRNTDLKASSAQPVVQAVPVAQAAAVPVEQPSKGMSDKMADFFGAYAADLPIAYKAARPELPGQFRIWGEGGAIWSGGDPMVSNYSLFNLATLGNEGGQFNLNPKIGWEAATGFDYRFAGSPYHVSGQFRYGETGKASGSASLSSTLDPALIALLGGGNNGLPAGAVIGGTQAQSASYIERHWLADLTFGRDVVGNGPDALQVKGGLRIAEFTGTTNTRNASNFFANFPVPFNIGNPIGPISSASISTSTVTDTRASFLGAGPVVGITGSIPFAGKWSFDYTGDAGVLFGTQQSDSTATTAFSATPAILNLLVGGLGNGGNNVNTTTTERFATVFSGDIQAGVSYWVTPNVKVGASYRLDALINLQNQRAAAVTNITPDRYTHGPRLTVTGQF